MPNPKVNTKVKATGHPVPLTTPMRKKRPESSTTVSSHVTAHSYIPGQGFAGKVDRGNTLYTGPDGLGHHRIDVVRDHQFVGNGEMSRERTTGLSYLNRPPSGTKFPLAKNGRIGEIGWPVEYFGIVKGL